MEGSGGVPIPTATAGAGRPAAGARVVVEAGVVRAPAGRPATGTGRAEGAPTSGAARPCFQRALQRGTEGVAGPPIEPAVTITTGAVAATTTVGAVVDSPRPTRLLETGSVTGVPRAAGMPVAIVVPPDTTRPVYRPIITTRPKPTRLRWRHQEVQGPRPGPRSVGAPPSPLTAGTLVPAPGSRTGAL